MCNTGHRMKRDDILRSADPVPVEVRVGGKVRDVLIAVAVPASASERRCRSSGESPNEGHCRRRDDVVPPGVRQETSGHSQPRPGSVSQSRDRD
jgi:hypothetical protein